MVTKVAWRSPPELDLRHPTTGHVRAAHKLLLLLLLPHYNNNTSSSSPQPNARSPLQRTVTYGTEATFKTWRPPQKLVPTRG